MKNICLQIILSILFCFQFMPNALSEDRQKEYKELGWNDLMPADWEPEPQSNSYGKPDNIFSEKLNELFETDVPVVEELNEKNVKIPGFIIPIEFDDASVTEFLLVPYMGACIHAPSPPLNQMVYVILNEPMSSGNLWDPVWVSGKMLTQKKLTDVAVAGYTIETAFTSKYVFE